MMSFKNVILIVMFFCFQINVFAHYIWIEANSSSEIGITQTIKIYYGEFNENLREVKGGRLEEVEGIECWAIAPNGERIDLKVKKVNKYYEVKLTPIIAGRYIITATNTVRNVVDWSKHNIGIVKPMYYTNKQIIVNGTSKQVVLKNSIHSKLAIIYKKSNNSKTKFQLLFNNKPFAKTKLFVHAKNTWSKEYKTDKNGMFSFNPLWEGTYVIECIYKEKKAGRYLNKNYEAIRHRATHTFIK